MTPIERMARAMLDVERREFDLPECSDGFWADIKLRKGDYAVLNDRVRAAILALATPEAIPDAALDEFRRELVRQLGYDYVPTACGGDHLRCAIAAAIRAAAGEKP